MKHQVRLENPTELNPGTRVKIPWPGYYVGATKRVVWFKGTIRKVFIPYTNGKATYVEISTRPNKYAKLGRVMIINEYCDYIYKVK